MGFWAALISVNAQSAATFDSIQLDSASWWNGSDGSGDFSDGSFWFPNNYNAEWGSWSGFSVSNMKDSTTAGWSNQYSAISCIDNFNGSSHDNPEIPDEAGMEDLQLAGESFYNGADGAGEFKSGGFIFQNSYNAEWESWSGFAASSETDTETRGWTNQYSSITGGGAIGTQSYAVAFPAGYSEIEFGKSIVSGFYITNSAYAFWSMKEGDDYAKKFGGVTGDDPDWFKVTIAGIAESGDTTSTIDYYLADFRFKDNSEDYIVEEWEWVDLSSLGEISKIRFSLSSSDMGDWGMNTPGYFCLDQLNHQDWAPVITNPVATIGEELNPQEVFYVPLDSVFSDPDNNDSEMELKLEGIDNNELLLGTVVSGGKPGEPSQTMLALNVTPGMTGEAVVIVSASSNGKTTYHSFKVVVNYPVSAASVSFADFKVYPNPVSTSFRVELGRENGNITLLNASGNVVFQKEIRNQPQLEISALKNQPPGIYLLNVNIGNENHTRKLLKK